MFINNTGKTYLLNYETPLLNIVNMV